MNERVVPMPPRFRLALAGKGALLLSLGAAFT